MDSDQLENIKKSHQFFSVECFNATWDLLDKAQKTEEDMEKMIHLTHASFWHWTEISTVTKTNISIGYWQLSRVYAVAGKGEESLYYGEKCLDVSLRNQLEPFTIGYGYEAVARAYRVLKNKFWLRKTRQKRGNIAIR